jgi:hypothetical protein
MDFLFRLAVFTWILIYFSRLIQTQLIWPMAWMGLAIGLTHNFGSSFDCPDYVAGHAIWSQYLNIIRVPLGC